MRKSGNPVTQTIRIRLDNTSRWGVAGHCKRIFLKWKDSTFNFRGFSLYCIQKNIKRVEETAAVT